MNQIRVGVKGWYTLRILKQDGTCKRELSFPNIITDTGLSRLTIGDSVNPDLVAAVGTSSIEESSLDTQLYSRFANSNTLVSCVLSSNGDTEPYWTQRVARYRFNVGVAAGNISEVGIVWLENSVWNAWSRSLVRDEFGEPTTITVLSDEVLDIYYTLRMYAPPPIISSFNLGAVAADGTATSATGTTLVDSTASWSTDEFQGMRIRILSGLGEGQIRDISSNSSTEITVSDEWSTVPDNTSLYEIGDSIYIMTTAPRAVAGTNYGTTFSAPINNRWDVFPTSSGPLTRIGRTLMFGRMGARSSMELESISGNTNSSGRSIFNVSLVYVEGTSVLSINTAIPLDSANLELGIGQLEWVFTPSSSLVHTSWQAVFNPRLPKTELDEILLTIQITYGRYAP